MTQFHGYILEDEFEEERKEADKVIDLAIRRIRRDCKPWLNEIKKCPAGGRAVYRGVFSEDEWIHKNVRKNRKPQDLSMQDHKFFGEKLKERFGWNPRSEGLFVVADKSGALVHGSGTYIVFPVGFKRFIYSPDVIDLFYIIKRNKNWEQIINSYTDKNLCSAIASENEIMIQCSSYYGIEISVFNYTSHDSVYFWNAILN